MLEQLEQRRLLTTFSNPAAISINDIFPAVPYPSDIVVAGFPTGSTIDEVTVTIHNFSHSSPEDIDMLLVGPGGQNAIIWSDVGIFVPTANPVTITLDDAAASSIPDISQLTSGTFKPTNSNRLRDDDSFFSPAPAPDGGSALAAFNGGHPNGTWSLYVVNDHGSSSGTISGGWSLNIATTEPPANLSITETANKDVVIAREELIYNIHVHNAGPDTALNVAVTDTLPTGVVFLGDTAITTPAGGCTGTTVLTCNIGNIPSGQDRDFNIKILVPADFVSAEADGTKTIINTASVTSTSVDSDQSDNTSTIGTFVEDSADLRVIKISKPDDTVRAGENFTYTIYVENLGPSYARGVQLSDLTISNQNFQIVSVVDDPNRTDSCTIVPPFGSATKSSTIDCILIDANPSGGTPTDALEPLGNNVNPPPVPNTGIWTIQVVARSAPVDPMSMDLSHASQPFDVDDTVRVFTRNTTPGSSGPSTPDPDNSNNLATDRITVTPVSDLRVFSTFGAEVQVNGLPGNVFNSNVVTPMPDPTCCNFGDTTTVTAGRRFQWDASVINAGPSVASNVRIEVLLPAGTSLIENTLTGLPTPGGVAGRCYTRPAGEQRTTVICQYGDVLRNETASQRFIVLVDPSLPVGTQLTFDAIASSGTFDAQTDDNVTSIQFDTNAFADLALTKTSVGENVIGFDATLNRLLENDVAGAVTAGKVLRYQVTVNNKGPSLSPDTKITDALPSAPLPGPVTFLTADGADCRPDAVNNDSLVCSLGELAPGASKTFDIYLRVDPSVPAGTVLTNCVSNAQITPDPFDTDSDNICTTTTVNAVADLVIIKSAVPPKLLPGNELRFHIGVENLGSSAASNVIVTDTLPPGIHFEFDTDTCSLFSTNPDVVQCTLGTLQPGQVVEFDIFGEVAAATPSGAELCNTAVVASTAPPAPPTTDFNLTNNTATACAFTVPGAKLSVTKEGPATINPGTNITYIITVSNSGPTAAIDVVLQDFVPTGERTLSVTPSVGNCLAGVEGDPRRPTTCNLDTIEPGDSVEITVVVEADNCLHDLNKLFNDVTVSTDTFDPDNSDNVFHTTTEVRQTSNGNVTAVVSNGRLTVVGDNFNNTIRFDTPVGTALDPLPEPNALRITPFGGTLINGQCRSVQLHGVRGSVSIRMGQANDTVIFDGPITLHKSLTTYMGRGNDIVTLDEVDVAGKASVRVDGDHDRVTVLDSVLGSLAIRMGKIDDVVDIEGTRVFGTTSIRCDGSNDTVRIFDSIFDGAVTIRGGLDATDTLDIGILSDPNASGNALNDALTVRNFENVIS